MVHKVVVLLEENEYHIEFILPEYNWSPAQSNLCAVAFPRNSQMT